MDTTYTKRFVGTRNHRHTSQSHTWGKSMTHTVSSSSSIKLNSLKSQWIRPCAANRTINWRTKTVGTRVGARWVANKPPCNAHTPMLDFANGEQTTYNSKKKMRLPNHATAQRQTLEWRPVSASAQCVDWREWVAGTGNLLRTTPLAKQVPMSRWCASWTKRANLKKSVFFQRWQAWQIHPRSLTGVVLKQCFFRNNKRVFCFASNLVCFSRCETMCDCQLASKRTHQSSGAQTPICEF